MVDGNRADAGESSAVRTLILPTPSMSARLIRLPVTRTSSIIASCAATKVLGASVPRLAAMHGVRNLLFMFIVPRCGLTPFYWDFFALDDQWTWTIFQPAAVDRSTIVSALKVTVGLPSFLTCISLSLATHARSPLTRAVRRPG